MLQDTATKSTDSRQGQKTVMLYIYPVSWHTLSYVVRHKKDETDPIAREPRVGGERQTDGYRTCSDLSQPYKAQLDHFTQYKWTHLQT